MPQKRKGYWTCQRLKTIDGVRIKCSRVNPNKKRLCEACGGAKRTKRPPKHRAVLKTMTHEQFAEIQAGSVEKCGICDAPPKARRLHRDHDHATGKPRGLLCMRCNTGIRDYMNLEWMRRAVIYLERAEAFHDGDLRVVREASGEAA